MEAVGYIIAMAVLGSFIIATFISTVCMCQKYRRLISRHRINLKEENYNRIDVTQVDPAVYEQHNDQAIEELPDVATPQVPCPPSRHSGYIDVKEAHYQTASEAQSKPSDLESHYAEI